MRIGIMGGTFNPPHIGHINAAEAARRELSLSKLILIPTATPPHKEMAKGSATAEQRLDMTRLLAKLLGAEVSDIEIARGGKSYTVDTLTALSLKHPQDELWLIVGTDMFLTLEEWKNPEKIFELSSIACVPRSDDDKEKLLSHSEFLRKKHGANTRIIDVPAVTISSSELRPEAQAEETEEFIPEAILSYIRENKLYAKAATELD